MAVQKSKVTRARRDKRRASNFNSRIKPVSISVIQPRVTSIYHTMTKTVTTKVFRSRLKTTKVNR